MCIEFAFKKGGIGILKNFMYSAEAVMGGLPTINRNRMKVQFRVRKYANGKLDSKESYWVKNFYNNKKE